MRHKASELLHHPVTYIPFDAGLIAEAKNAYRTLMEMFREFGVAKFTRHGEIEADLGLISRDGKQGADFKVFFHFASDLGLHLIQKSPELADLVKPHMHVLRRLYDEVNTLAVNIARVIDEGHGRHFTRSLEEVVRQAAKPEQPYETTTLRGLYYPPVEGQTGARTHIDRSLFSVHFGDEGGQLMTCKHEKGKQHQAVNIPEGHVAMFRGVKLWLLSRRKFHPVWHCSTTVPGKPRLAMVQFIQAETPGFRVHKAKETYQMFG